MGWAVDEGIRSDNPTRWIDNPSLPATLPKSLGEAEIVQLLDAAARLTPAFSAIRAVTMLEVLYATGLRVSELMGLEVSAFRRQPDTILITGKGGRERMVPLGDTAKAAVARWLECRDSHPVFMLSDMMFPAENGRAMTRQAFAALLKKLALAADLDPAGQPTQSASFLCRICLIVALICEVYQVYLAMPTYHNANLYQPARPVGRLMWPARRLPHGSKIDKRLASDRVRRTT